MSNTETAAVAALRSQLRSALEYIETLETALEAARRREADGRLAGVVDRKPSGRPKIRKPLRPRTDEEWQAMLRRRRVTA
jgi:hypothetical protein